MSTERAFLAALAADPFDDATRLVYADWLDEHGQSHKARYLRNEAAMAGCPRYGDQVELCLMALEHIIPNPRYRDPAWVDAAGRRYDVEAKAGGRYLTAACCVPWSAVGRARYEVIAQARDAGVTVRVRVLPSADMRSLLRVRAEAGLCCEHGKSQGVAREGTGGDTGMLDPHPGAAREVIEYLSRTKGGRLLIDDLNRVRRSFGFDPFGPGRDDDPPDAAASPAR